MNIAHGRSGGLIADANCQCRALTFLNVADGPKLCLDKGLLKWWCRRGFYWYLRLKRELEKFLKWKGGVEWSGQRRGGFVRIKGVASGAVVEEIQLRNSVEKYS